MLWILNLPKKIIFFLLQFPDVVSFSDEMAERGKIVIVAALDGTFQKKVQKYRGSYVQ